MKIKNSNIWTIKSKVEQKSRNRYGAVNYLERTLLRLEDEEGNEGWGEMMPIIFTSEKADNATTAIQTAVESLKEMPEIEPVSNSNIIDTILDFSELKAARSSIECALLDIESKREQKDFLQKMEGTHKSIKLDGPIGLESPEDAIKKTKQYLSEGVSTVKVKVGVNVREDASRLIALRKEFGDDIEIRMDANGGYTDEEVFEFCNLILPVAVQHFEQPVLPSNKRCFEICREIREMGIPVAADESLFSLQDAETLVQEDALDVGVIKISKFGGVLIAKKIANLLESADKKCVISASYESLIGKSMALALALSLQNTDLAHEVGHFAKEPTITEWAHSNSNGIMSYGHCDGLGAKGDLEKISAIATNSL